MELIWLLAALLLPLFPSSIVFNLLYRRLPNAWARAVVLLAWPQLGVWLLGYASAQTGSAPPDWLLAWALFTALLYGFRAVALRDLNIWIGFIAVSAWALFPLLMSVDGPVEPALHMLGFSAPLALLALLANELERRFGAAYAGLPGSLAPRMPRYAALLVLAMLAAVATPVFPAFFSLLTTVVQTASTMPGLTTALIIVWLLWSWSSARLLQGLLVGSDDAYVADDLSIGSTWMYSLLLFVLAAAGIALAGTGV